MFSQMPCSSQSRTRRQGKANYGNINALYPVLQPVLAKSQDGGQSFGKNLQVAANVCPCCRPRVETGNHGEVFVTWRHVFEGNIRDMVVATSRDGGQTFARPFA
jgi:hypothetical protein